VAFPTFTNVTIFKRKVWVFWNERNCYKYKMFDKKKRWSQKTSNRNTVKNREIHAMIHTVDWIESIFDSWQFWELRWQFERNGTTLCCQKVPNSGEGWFLLFQHCNTHRFYRIFTIYNCTRFSLFFSDRIDFHFLDKRAKWKSSKRRSLHTDARTFNEPGMSDMIDAIDITVRKL